MDNKQDYYKIKLSQEDKIKLDFFLTITTNYRENELKAWQEFSKEKNEDGTPVYKNAMGNAKWWGDLCESVIRIKEAIKNCEHIQEFTNDKDEPDICE